MLNLQNFGHTDLVCGKGVVRKEKIQSKVVTDRDGFQKPRRQQLRQKARKGVPTVHRAETSNTSKDPLASDTMVGVGSIKQVSVEPKLKERDPQTDVGIGASDKPVKPIVEGAFCTVDAGRTPGGKDGVVQPSKVTVSDPELVESVVHTFKQHLKPRRGVIISDVHTNRFSPLNSEDSSDDDDMTIIDTSRLGEGGCRI